MEKMNVPLHCLTCKGFDQSLSRCRETTSPHYIHPHNISMRLATFPLTPQDAYCFRPNEETKEETKNELREEVSI